MCYFVILLICYWKPQKRLPCINRWLQQELMLNVKNVKHLWIPKFTSSNTSKNVKLYTFLRRNRKPRAGLIIPKGLFILRSITSQLFLDAYASREPHWQKISQKNKTENLEKLACIKPFFGNLLSTCLQFQPFLWLFLRLFPPTFCFNFVSNFFPIVLQLFS